jgi:uncharacterized coiled-coil protein SlyX
LSWPHNPMNEIEQASTYLTAHPTEKGCVSEVLIRGDFGGPGWGIIKGAHFRLALTQTDPLGRVTRIETPPLRAGVVPDSPDTPIAAIVGQVMIQQQRTIDELNATVAANATQISALQSQLSTANAQIADLQKRVADLTPASPPPSASPAQ